MRITQEADYAIRICLVLDSLGRKAGAIEISELACITQRFALKILRKLGEAGFVKSYKGAQGGYELATKGDKLNILSIVEAIDGPVRISKCLECDYECSRNARKVCCKMHLAFGAINKNLTDDLSRITVRMLHDDNVSGSDISNIISKNNYTT